MRFSICNEMFLDTPFDEVCRVAQEIGYRGVEIAPFTFADNVNDISPGQREEIVRTAERHQLEIVGIHWLLVKPEGLHMSTPDDELRLRTRDYFVDLVNFCGDLGGSILVCGSPKQRNVIDSYEASWQRLVDTFKHVAAAAGERGVTFCIEPLGPSDTEFLMTGDEGARMVNDVNHPNFQMILDVKAMSGAETDPLPEVIKRNAQYVRHFHANDPNLLGPGMGELDHTAIGQALRDIHYSGWVSVEVFKFELGGAEIARQSFAALQRWYG